jgi:hypothetical protein
LSTQILEALVVGRTQLHCAFSGKDWHETHVVRPVRMERPTHTGTVGYSQDR